MTYTIELSVNEEGFWLAKVSRFNQGHGIDKVTFGEVCATPGEAITTLLQLNDVEVNTGAIVRIPGKFTGLKYDEVCGWYAVRNGRIVCPPQGISGQKIDAEYALATATTWASIDWHAVEPLPEVERWKNVPGYQERYGHF